jgi:hypothetical protein
MIASPVRGLRPVRGSFLRTVNLPKPVRTIRHWSIIMYIGPDVELFISTAEALLQSISEEELSEEEAEELTRSLLVFPPEYGREAP